MARNGYLLILAEGATAAAGFGLLLKFGPTDSKQQRTQDHVPVSETVPTGEETFLSSSEFDKLTEVYRAKGRERRETPVTQQMIASLEDSDLDDRIWSRLLNRYSIDETSLATAPKEVRAYLATREFEWEFAGRDRNTSSMNPSPNIQRSPSSANSPSAPRNADQTVSSSSRSPFQRRKSRIGSSLFVRIRRTNRRPSSAPSAGVSVDTISSPSQRGRNVRATASPTNTTLSSEVTANRPVRPRPEHRTTQVLQRCPSRLSGRTPTTANIQQYCVETEPTDHSRNMRSSPRQPSNTTPARYQSRPPHIHLRSRPSARRHRDRPVGRATLPQKHQTQRSPWTHTEQLLCSSPSSSPRTNQPKKPALCPRSYGHCNPERRSGRGFTDRDGHPPAPHSSSGSTGSCSNS